MAEWHARRDRRGGEQAMQVLREVEGQLADEKEERRSLRRKLRRSDEERRKLIADAEKDKESLRRMRREAEELRHNGLQQGLELIDRVSQLESLKTSLSDRGVTLVDFTAVEIDRALDRLKNPFPTIRLRINPTANGVNAVPADEASGEASTSQIAPAATNPAPAPDRQPSPPAIIPPWTGAANEGVEEEEEAEETDHEHGSSRSDYTSTSGHLRRERRRDRNRRLERGTRQTSMSDRRGMRRHAVNEEIRRRRRERGRRLLGRSRRAQMGERRRREII